MIKGVLASIAIVLVLVLSVAITSSEASEETYQTEYGGQWIKLISSSELEYHTGDATFLCKYSTQKGSLRVIMAVLGTQQVLYFHRTSAGLVSEKGLTFFSPAALAEHRRQAALAQRAQEKARAEEQQRRSEEQRLANIAAQRQAEEQRLADDRARKEAPEKLRALLAPRPTLNGTYQTGYGPRKMWLKVTSFDSGTGSVTADVDDVDVKQGAPNHTVGNVSGDTLTLTSDSKPSMRYRLRYDGLGRKLTGTWDTGEKTPGGGAEFALP